MGLRVGRSLLERHVGASDAVRWGGRDVQRRFRPTPSSASRAGAVGTRQV